MRVVVTSEYHFRRGPDAIYTDAVYPYAFWEKLLATFDEVVVLARVRDGALPDDARPVTGPGVSVAAVPEFVGSGGLVRGLPGLLRAAWAAGDAGDAFVLRAPGVIATALHGVLRLRGRPYGIHVVGDPRDSLASGDRAMRALRAIAAAQLRAQVRGASASRFVTRRFLQERYPPRPGTVTIAVSDLELPDALLDAPPPPVRAREALDLAFIGSLERDYKGLDVLIDALAVTARAHRLDVVGDGVLRATYEARAASRGLGGRIRFLGRLPPGEPIYAFLRGRDLVVLPSRTEGLPRVLIEAMAVGVPALATPVGGVPELLDPAEHLVVDDVAGLARAIDGLAADPARRAHLVARYREVARRFRASEVARELRRFHEAVRDTAHS